MRAGFIGAALSHRLLDGGDEVVGLDDLNDYYDVSLKEARLERLCARAGFEFSHLNIADRAGMSRTFEQGGFQRVVHLAAQAGVRYSLENPHAYVDANLLGFMNILEGVRYHPVEHLVYASSSSVYGANQQLPFSVEHNVDHPVSLYAATKKANELMAQLLQSSLSGTEHWATVFYRVRPVGTPGHGVVHLYPQNSRG